MRIGARYKKKIKILLIVIMCFFVLCFTILCLGPLIIGGFFNQPVSQERMMDIFKKDYELLHEIVVYCDSIEYEHVRFDMDMQSHEISMSISGENIEFKNKSIEKTIHTLMNKGYVIIEKYDNNITFQRWANMDADRGFVFSLDGEKPTLQFLIKLKKLNKKNWYYYETDFNKWRLGDN